MFAPHMLFLFFLGGGERFCFFYFKTAPRSAKRFSARDRFGSLEAFVFVGDSNNAIQIAEMLNQALGRRRENRN